MSKSPLSLGFSLIELLVVVGIFITITSIVLFNQNRFSSNIAIQNLAYQIALSLREAQVYGLSVRGSSPDSNAIFDTAFGIHFACNSPTQFILFADIDKDGRFNASNGDISRSTYTLDTGNKINNITTTYGGSSASCGGLLADADVTFRRPNPEALIRDNFRGSINLTQLDIDIISALGTAAQHQTISVTQTGQIFVK